jgi:hypothetical protein
LAEGNIVTEYYFSFIFLTLARNFTKKKGKTLIPIDDRHFGYKTNSKKNTGYYFYY